MGNPFTNLLSLGGDRKLRAYRSRVERINSLEAPLKDLANDELRSRADALRERAANGEKNDSLLDEAFALSREAGVRTVGLRAYDVQLIGGMALNDGCVAEMKTGEGKTLVSAAPVFLNSLNDDNVHVVTVNDYLAKRDSEWLAPLFGLLGMSVGLLQNGMSPADRVPQYAAHATYGTNSEFGFDYLRDNMVPAASGRVQRGHSFAIVDEADSILVDEARTPLIISGPGAAAAADYARFAAAVNALDPEEDVRTDEKRRTVYATERGLDRIEGLLGVEIYMDATGTLANHLRQALRARFLFKRDIDYIVDKGEVKIVDEFTGRVMEGRRYSEGLHQALEAKEGVEVKAETHTMATVTLQNYFRLYKKLSGMTGTALSEDAEFRRTYKMPVVAIPTNKPVIRIDRPDVVYRTREAKYEAVADEVAKRYETGQPVLVGTSSIEGSERVSELLRRRGVPHEVLNAKNHEREARIVAQAGRFRAVTIATNMAGRGTDILLGGNADFLEEEECARMEADGITVTEPLRGTARDMARNIVEREGTVVRRLGGLCVIGTDRHDSRRIDDQLRGRAGRQGDPGESRFCLSLDDRLLRIFGGDRLKAVSDMMVARGIPDNEPVEDNLVVRAVAAAQAQVEAMHNSSRKSVLEYDDVMDLQRKAIYHERDAILDGKDVSAMLPEIARDMIDAVLDEACSASDVRDDWDFEAADAWFADMTGDEGFSSREACEGDDPDTIGDAMEERMRAILDERRNAVGDEAFERLCAKSMLRTMDQRWVEHLTDMDALKAGIGLRAMGHRDPLSEYRDEAYRAFGEMTETVYEGLVRTMLRMPVAQSPVQAAVLEAALGSGPFDPSKMVYSESAGNGEGGQSKGLDRVI